VIPANRPRNYLQSALYVAIAGVIAAMLVERLLTYAEIAEKASMEATVSQLNTALYAHLAYLALRGEYEAIEAMRGTSPFASADVRSAAYLGEIDNLPPDAERGKWYFDRSTRELVYLPRFKRHLANIDDRQATGAARFVIDLRQSSKHAYTGAALRPTGAWVWEPEL